MNTYDGQVVNSLNIPGSTLPAPAGIEHSTTPPNSSPGMPPIPRAEIDKIRNGEFVNFDNLLPNHNPVNQDEYTFKEVGGSITLVPKRQNKPKVLTFNSWMLAWTVFFRAYSQFWPHRTQELIAYQGIICNFATQYSFTSILVYDRLFRLRLAQDQTLSWSRVDDNLYNVHLRGSALQTACFNCHTFGHFANACPLKGQGSSNQPFRVPQRVTAGSGATILPIAASPPVPPPSGNSGACFYYNKGQCNKSSNCRFAHVCMRCGGPHPASSCHKPSSR